ncbi:type II toxin-antitoxin system RelE/ParE family toxin [Halanaerobiaceae bacterium Z-7014]|uniref:Type II toxin-antitoxin system RelE/ParE family toxin n=1 Tax=Halonatronomonas betaini TaxID=2778430 RepID=A0A931AMN4_9FIRM|nr:type II toxin-antitoxin system RelE/ParE family toxin [Halonatronomonas betaini]MBF8435532.1 type II toxin-antitoxin system RelE/ParE family toxin [Halonatronomonas betaini]
MSNKKYNIRYLPLAQKDLNEIVSYLQTDSPDYAEKLIDQFDNEISQLILFPYKGKVPEDESLKKKNYRMLIIDNYIIFYVVFETNNLIEIRRIIHGKRKYKFLL